MPTPSIQLIFQALRRTSASMLELRSWRVIVLSSVIALMLLIFGFGGLWRLASGIVPPEAWWSGYFLGATGVVAAMVGGFFLFPPLILTVTSFFLDQVVDTVDTTYYHESPGQSAQDAAGATFSESARSGLALAGKGLVLNIVALPFYLVPFLGLVLYYCINGYLFGREYFLLTAFRKHSRQESEALYKANSKTVLLAGVLIAVLLTIPFVNLIASVAGAHLMVHLHRLMRQPTP